MVVEARIGDIGALEIFVQRGTARNTRVRMLEALQGVPLRMRGIILLVLLVTVDNLDAMLVVSLGGLIAHGGEVAVHV